MTVEIIENPDRKYGELIKLHTIDLDKQILEYSETTGQSLYRYGAFTLFESK